MHQETEKNNVTVPALHSLLQQVVEKGASDLHITMGSPPVLRIDGNLVPLALPSLTQGDCEKLCYSVLIEEQKYRFQEEHELDLSFSIQSGSRFRANFFIQRGSVAGCFRQIPQKILSPEVLGLSPSIIELCKKPRGLVLVTGPTGSGKSTTLASLIDKINRTDPYHIITVEDPIEFVHTHKRSIVNQREVHSDTESFKKALKYILRQDPDVVMLGELRDLETIEAALTIAETGHLCFATLHTNSAAQTLTRIIDVFPPHQQMQVRIQLSFVLEGIISQSLLLRASGKGRVLATEVLLITDALRNIIREDKIEQIYTQMQMGQAQHGMHTFNQSLFDLYQKQWITIDEALSVSHRPEELKRMVMNMGSNGSVGQRAMQMSKK